LRWADDLIRHAGELTALVHAEHGKPVDEGFLELAPALEQIRWAARHAGRVLRTRRVTAGMTMANHAAWVEYEPYGVVAVIGPWNYPIFTPTGSVAYALAAGNTVVFKPSEYTPAVGSFLVDSFHRANPMVDPGVLGLVTGDGEAGAALCRAPVDKIAFTGSPATGRKVLDACAARMVPALLECGGNDAMIVAEDADVRAAAEAAAWGGMSNSGQTCVGVERVYVVEAVRGRFVAELARQLEGVMPGADDSAVYGPMTMPSQLDTVRRHVADALDQGATSLLGGPDSVRPPFVEPVVLLDAPETCSAVREETFGPTLTVNAVPDVEEAIRRSNDTGYALGASVFSRRSGTDIAKRMKAGMVAVNCALSFVGVPALPFGGRGESGFGSVHGADGLREFARPKSYARKLFGLSGLEVTVLRRTATSMNVVRALMTLRHRRFFG
jgi:aldehyde dehydrogenase (NAD+)